MSFWHVIVVLVGFNIVVYGARKNRWTLTMVGLAVEAAAGLSGVYS